MPKYATKAYDFAYRTGKKLPDDGLIGDPEVRRQQAPPQNRGPKTPRTVIGRVLIPVGDSAD